MIIGARDEHPEDLGITIEYSPSKSFGAETVSLQQAMHLGTAGRNAYGWNEYLDSCGCFVLYDGNNFRNGARIDYLHLTALIMAHEVGHALGLMHYDDVPGIMNTSFDIDHEFYNHYYRFANPSQSDQQNHFQMNLRQKLGCEVIESKTCPWPLFTY